MAARLTRNWFSRVAAARRHDPDVELEHCPSCEQDFVYPVQWESVTHRSWWMQLRCGACDSWREVTVPNGVAERFDTELDRRADVMHRALDRLDRAEMVTSANTLITALRLDLIDAADFGNCSP